MELRASGSTYWHIIQQQSDPGAVAFVERLTAILEPKLFKGGNASSLEKALRRKLTSALEEAGWCQLTLDQQEEVNHLLLSCWKTEYAAALRTVCGSRGLSQFLG